jgi:hypothetical protein
VISVDLVKLSIVLRDENSLSNKNNFLSHLENEKKLEESLIKSLNQMVMRTDGI